MPTPGKLELITCADQITDAIKNLVQITLLTTNRNIPCVPKCILRAMQPY